jgi:hypothetical protein
LTVFKTKKSKIGHTKTAFAAKAAKFLWNDFRVAEELSKNKY